jgi:membrane protein implicated in regulation of membrane protease activity
MIWVGIGIICMIIEIFTPGFLFMSFGIGAILTGLASLLINGIGFQILIFAVITFIVFLNLRKFSKKLISQTTEETNIFALKDKEGLVIKEIPDDGRGYVKIGGEEWSAVSKDGKRITEGTKIRVSSFEGNKLIVNVIEEV